MCLDDLLALAYHASLPVTLPAAYAKALDQVAATFSWVGIAVVFIRPLMPLHSFSIVRLGDKHELRRTLLHPIVELEVY
jgi:hypothetical protein